MSQNFVLRAYARQQAGYNKPICGVFDCSDR